ncbi:O-antigen ligase family protein [uncultured Fibrobacter sp.]|uniref:O-antigen ligase family protein n=1 Tax=uncultured Fibrobacter sp. TaxID=261512 RepID=UPI0025F48FA2|nr:O-antigen ligase family protein [uncultured Fibrobacter sp.]
MIPKFVILILLPILLTVVYLGSADENVIGIVSLGIMLVGLFCTMVIKTPIWGCLLLIISLHWFQLEGISYSIYLMFLASAVFTLYVTRAGDLKIDKAWLFLMLSQFAYLALLVLVRPYQMMMIFFFVNVTGLAFFLGASLVRWDASKVQKLLTVHMSFMIIWAFVERIISTETRIEGPSLSSTNFAVLLAVSWTIWFINGWLSKKTNVLWLGLVSILVFVSILFSGTRMGILGMGMGSVLAVMGKLLIVQRARVMGILFRFTIIIAVLALCAVGLWALLPDDLFLKQGFQLLLSGKMDASSMGRIAAWRTALSVIKSHTLWGVGPGNFLAYNVEFLARYNFLPIVQTLPRLGHAHNLLLMVLSEQGLIGLATLMIICITCAKRLLVYIRYLWDGFGFALLSGGLVTLFLGLFDVFPLFPSSLGWGAWYMGVLFSLKAASDKAREQSLEPRDVGAAAEVGTAAGIETSAEVGASANLGAAADVKTSVLETSADQVSETGSTSEGGK